MIDRGPIDGRYPAVFCFRKRYDAIDQQFIELALRIHIIRVQGQEQALAQLDLLLRQILHGADAIQPNAALRVGVVEVRVDSWLRHAVPAFPFPAILPRRNELVRLRIHLDPHVLVLVKQPLVVHL